LPCADAVGEECLERLAECHDVVLAGGTIGEGSVLRLLPS
jgi:hypothetical protein